MSTTLTVLKPADLAKAKEIVETNFDSVQRWRDKPRKAQDATMADDVTMEVKNIINRPSRALVYVKMRDDLVQKYGLSEEELLTQVLEAIAAA